IERELARRPPVSCAAGFEVRLGAGAATVDFATLIAGRSPGVAALARLDAPGSAHAALLVAPAWRRLAALGRRWCEPPLRDELASVILEFDAQRVPRAVPSPSVFVQLVLDACDPARARPEGALPILPAAAAPPRAALDRLFACLPSGGRVLQLAAMLGRSEALRVFLSVPRDALAELLRAVAWPGDVAAIRQLCKRHAPERGRLALQLDLGA